MVLLWGACAPQPAARTPEASEQPFQEAVSQAKSKARRPADSAHGDSQAEPSSSIFLSQLRVVASPRAQALVLQATSDSSFASGLQVNIEVLSSNQRFGEVTRRAKKRVKKGMIALPALSELGSADKPTRAQTKSSFIIDFDQPKVQQMLRPLEGNGPPPAPERIEAFVNQHIEQKTYIRSFDVASRVADNRAGDCTEHAVLTAAALRYFGYPARVVLGVVLVGVQDEDAQVSVMAAGHAWVEYYEDKRWHVSDAALLVGKKETNDRIGVVGLPEAGKVLKAYVPINVLKNESVGYARALMNEPGIEAVLQLSLDAPDSQPDTSE